MAVVEQGKPPGLGERSDAPGRAGGSEQLNYLQILPAGQGGIR